MDNLPEEVRDELLICEAGCGAPPCKRRWPDPTPEMLADPRFEAIWQAIKSWDINVPSAYGGYCGATGNHVRAILDALTVQTGD